MTATATAPSSYGNIADRLLGLKGSFAGVCWSRPMKTRAGVTAEVTKSVRTTVQVGVSYDNRECVKDARADGSAPAENAGLPWGEWVQYPYVIGHKGRHYVRLYPVRDGAGKPRSCKVIYKVDGKTVTREDVEALCPKSEFSAGTPTECYTLAVDNLRAVRVNRRAMAKTNFLGKE